MAAAAGTGVCVRGGDGLGLGPLQPVLGKASVAALARVGPPEGGHQAVQICSRAAGAGAATAAEGRTGS